MRNSTVLLTAILATSVLASPDTCFAEKKTFLGVMKQVPRKTARAVGRFLVPGRVRITKYNDGKKKIEFVNFRTHQTRLQKPDGTQILKNPSEDHLGAIQRTVIKPDGKTIHQYTLDGRRNPEKKMKDRTKYRKMTALGEYARAIVSSPITWVSGAVVGIPAVATGIALTVGPYVAEYQAYMSSF